ncbi:unnamed protein product [Chondrus crispus]|uniref:Uncharacterized protein n=1 Tax=Chondrus crispus TaxID=2769 RepID=R7QH87_CHOCR|nr:unnamed protein product [Chondrus crispus]CDF36831.1 unnamed protein product [Chondrus crispus]|eukprot:XP_005716650.1 unnamed protein product [Chondrus crispus]
MLSGTSHSSAAQKLPFEKPIYESEILRKAKQEVDSNKKLEFYGNIAVIAVGISVLARVGYYIVYGKEGGAQAVPRRTAIAK